MVRSNVAQTREPSKSARHFRNARGSSGIDRRERRSSHRRAWSFTVLLPDDYAVWQGEVKLVSRLNRERGVPGIEIAHRICPILRRGVRIRQNLLAERSLTRFGCPVLAKSNEELLIPGEAVLCRSGFARE